MARTFEHTVFLELIFGRNATEEVCATIEFTATPIIPATWDDPAEGGEVEKLKVIDLFIPEVKAQPERQIPTPLREGQFTTVAEVKARPRVDLECPKWLEEMILEHADDETLLESVDFDDDYPDYD